MPETSLANGSFNRRAFIAGAASAGAITALAGCASEPSGENKISTTAGGSARVGISDSAYKKAWQRAAAIVSKMTLAEKIAQTGNGAPAIKRIGLPAYNYYSGEALHGLVRGGPVTSFPLPLAMACSWNPALALQVYTAVSDEARAYNKKENVGLAYYSPQTLNLHRDPRWGRCEEAPGEDPCLAGTWAVNVIKGMQGDNPNYLKTTACAKHFICNNTDDDRTSVSASVDPRSFWEYYTRAYRTCALDADVFTFMSAYSAINGIPCSADRFLLTSLLRDRWGFRGYVTSDCDAVYNIFNPHHYVPTLHQAAGAAMQAGCDLNCGNTMPRHLGKAVQDQLVSEADISRAVTRLLTVRVLFGEFDSPAQVPYSNIDFDVVDSQAHRALAVEAARQSIVLLKNDSNFLPLQKSDLKTVAVIGPTAGGCHLGGYSGSPFVRISPYQGIADALGAEIDVMHEHVWPNELQAVSAGVQTQASSEGGMNIGWIGNNAWVEYKPQEFTGKNRIAIRVASIIAGAVIRVHIDSLDGPQIATMTVPHTGGWQHWTTISAAIKPITGKHKVFFKFSGRGAAICNVEWFQLQPFIRPPVPQPKPGQPVVVYKPGCSVAGDKDEKMFNEAVAAAKQADVVIMVCGVDQSVDAEGHDREDIQLTGVQHELIKACYQANPKTVLVISSNNTVAVNWEQENLPAIVSAIFAGQAQGTAIADVLFGNYNPGGKTCCTWYQSVDQLPAFHNYDIMKGRTYMYFDGEPLYPFGYGLSYTSFKYSDLNISKAALAANESMEISAQITNTGLYAGAEIVQFYVQAPKSPVKRPIKQLVGFQRLELQPGESRRVVFTLPYAEQALWYWHEDQRKFVLQPGTLKLMIGSSSADIRLNSDVTLRPCSAPSMGGPETLVTAAVASTAL
jgi:beta-glucosidase